MAELKQNLQDSTMETTKKLRDAARSSLAASLELSYNALVVSLQESVAKLPERVFVNVFLPFFSGQAPLENYPRLFIDWISIAGAPNREVAIIDDSGEELFRVPSLLNTDVINLNSKNSFNRIFEEYELRNNYLPAIGQKYIAQAMEEKSKELIIDVDNLTSREKAWLDIFARYGIKFNTKTESNVNVAVNDDLEYD